MTFTIIFNGTGDRYYTSDQDYLEANKLQGIGTGTHTLSFFADCIAPPTEQAEEPLLSIAKLDHNLLKVSNELVIIKGADDTGTEVHNLIVSGLMATVNAILRGEEEIVFLGFSRGSVEATHMTHELQRIKNYLNDSSKEQSPEALVKFICEHCYNPSNLPYGRWRTDRITLLYKTALDSILRNPEHLQKLQHGLSHPDFKLKFSGMLLDPVPGMCEGSPLAYVPWTAISQHTEIPPMVDELTVAYMSDETSVGFRAVWIEAALNAQTQVHRFHLPGFHGTANGNPVNHDPSGALTSEPPFPFDKMRDVQTLYFYKLLQFAHKQHVVFHRPEQVAGRHLFPAFEHFIGNINNIAAQNEYLINLNKVIAANLSAYRKTRDTCYIPNFGIAGGSERAKDGERKIMTKTGERSLAECFDGFDIKGATAYINFDSFLLDFTTVLFPELTDSPHTSPPRNLSYSALENVVATRYDSPSPSTEDCSLLTNKIKTLLASCQSHQADHKLNKIILQEELDTKRILSKLAELVPIKLANAFYHPQLNGGEREELVDCITQIINFELIELDEDEKGSPEHLAIFIKKQAYLQKFKDNMRKVLKEQTTHTLNYLLESKGQFQCRAEHPTSDNMSESATAVSSESKNGMHQAQREPFDAFRYLAEAEEHYHALIGFQDKLHFAQDSFSAAEQQTIHCTIAEEIAQFPGLCERALRAQIGDAFSSEMLQYQVMRPLQTQLEHEARYQAVLSDSRVLRSSVASLERNVEQLIRDKNLLLTKLESAESTCRTLQADLDEQHAALSLKIQSTHQTLQSRIQSLQTANDELSNTIQDRSLAHAQEATGLRAHLDTIRHLLHQQSTGFLSGFTLQLISSLSIILGLMMTTLAAACLIAGTGGAVMPVVSTVAGSSIAVIGVFGLRMGFRQAHTQQLSENFFPAA